MSPILPVVTDRDRVLADVMGSVFSAVRRVPNPLGLAPANRAVVVLVDGLGAANLTARAAHARTLTALPRIDVVSGFPTTTASALTSLMTGAAPGETGMVGYAVRDPATGLIVNQLSGLDPERANSWQPVPTVWERNPGVPAAVISSDRYRHSGLTHAILRGADYQSARDHAERLGRIEEFVREHRDGVAYVYIPELDMTAHASGVGSDAWIRRLEELDGFVADCLRILGPTDGFLLTADHGVLDVPLAKHRIIPDGSPLTDGVLVGGEPRFLHLYTDGDPVDLRDRWRATEGERAHVVTRDEAIQAGWFGSVQPFARDRIGDVLVTPRGDGVYYDERSASAQSFAMIGQHGGLSRTEMLVPLARAKAFA